MFGNFRKGNSSKNVLSAVNGSVAATPAPPPPAPILTTARVLISVASSENVKNGNGAAKPQPPVAATAATTTISPPALPEGPKPAVKPVNHAIPSSSATTATTTTNPTMPNGSRSPPHQRYLVFDVVEPSTLGLKIKKENNAPMLVTGVSEVGQAKKLGLCVNDVIERVNNTATSTLPASEMMTLFSVRPLRLHIFRPGERFSPAQTKVGNRYDVLWRTPIVESERMARSKRENGHAPLPAPPLSGWHWRPCVITELNDVDLLHRTIAVQFLDSEAPSTAKDLPTGLNDRFLAPFELKSANTIPHHKYGVGDVLDVFWRGVDSAGNPPAPASSFLPTATVATNISHDDKISFAKIMTPSNVSFSDKSISNTTTTTTLKSSGGGGGRWMMASIQAFSPYWLLVHYLDHPLGNNVEEWVHVLEEEDRIAVLGHYTSRNTVEEATAQAQADFREKLKAKGMMVIDVPPDGNCLFRAISLQVYGDQSMHKEVREAICDYMLMNRDRFALYMPGDGEFDKYVQERTKNAVWGDDPEIRAAEELYDRPIEIYSCDLVGHAGKDVTIPIVFNFEGSTPPDMAMSENKIRLSFHGNNHYNAVLKVGSAPPKVSMKPEDNAQRIRLWRLGSGEAGWSNGDDGRKESVLDL